MFLIKFLARSPDAEAIIFGASSGAGSCSVSVVQWVPKHVSAYTIVADQDLLVPVGLMRIGDVTTSNLHCLCPHKLLKEDNNAKLNLT